MTLVKVDKAPTIKKIRLARPYLVHEETKQAYGFYEVSVRWADGTNKRFSSFEEANAYVEQRPVNQDALEKEVPEGYYRALQIENSYNVTETTTVAEPTDFDVMLVSFDDTAKVPIIKKIREITGLGLKESKELITNLPNKIRENMDEENAQHVKKELEDVGGRVELKPVN